MSNSDVPTGEEGKETLEEYARRVVAARGPRRPVRHDIPLHVHMRLVVEDARERIHAWEIRNNLPTAPLWKPAKQIRREGRRIRRCGEPLPIKQESFMDILPKEVVERVLWPLVAYGTSAVENFQICCWYRTVCKGWKEFIESTKEWEKGLEAWTAGEGRVIFYADPDPYASPTSESSDETDHGLEYPYSATSESD